MAEEEKNLVPALVKRQRKPDGNPWTFADLIRALGDRPYDRKLVYTKLQHPEEDLDTMTWGSIKALAEIFGVSPYELQPGNQGRAVEIDGTDRMLLAQALHGYAIRNEESALDVARIAAILGLGDELLEEGKAFGKYVKELELEKAGA